MTARLAADIVVVLHAAFALFAAFGGVLAWRWRGVAWAHVPAALWGAWVEYAGWICPVTPLEQGLRRAAGEAGYSGGFIEHYLLPLLYPAGLTASVQFWLGSFVVITNAAIYGWLVQRHFRRCSMPAGDKHG